jgi:hypothetical protein
VNAVFADTFYWIALTNPTDAAHERAREFTNDIVTTEEVLTEYLNYFCTGPAHLRRKAALIVEAVFSGPYCPPHSTEHCIFSRRFCSLPESPGQGVQPD